MEKCNPEDTSPLFTRFTVCDSQTKLSWDKNLGSLKDIKD